MIDVREAFPKIPEWDPPVTILEGASKTLAKEIDDKIVWEIQTQIGIEVDRDRILEIMADAQREYKRGCNDISDWVIDSFNSIILDKDMSSDEKLLSMNKLITELAQNIRR